MDEDNPFLHQIPLSTDKRLGLARHLTIDYCDLRIYLGEYSLEPGVHGARGLLFHSTTGVLLWEQCLVIGHGVGDVIKPKDWTLLFHYTSSEAFVAITSSNNLMASITLTTDCDFGVGQYGTAKPPHAFASKQDILFNNYPRATSKYRPGDREFPSEDKVAFCVPLLVRSNSTPALPLTDPNGPIGAVCEASDRHGHFDAALHDIWLVDAARSDWSYGASMHDEGHRKQFADQEVLAFHVACKQGKLDIARKCLDDGIPVDSIVTHTCNARALRKAVEGGHLQVAKLLCDRKADVNIKGGMTGSCNDALMYAVMDGRASIVRLLIDQRAEVNCTDDYDPDYEPGTPLMQAAKYGHAEIVQLLISGRACVNQCQEYGKTALTVAASEDIRVQLLRSGARKQLQTRHGSCCSVS